MRPSTAIAPLVCLALWSTPGDAQIQVLQYCTMNPEVCMVVPMILGEALRNALDPGFGDCPYGKQNHMYTFAGKTISLTGQVISQSQSPLSCASCAAMANYSAYQLGGAAICNDTNDNYWNYATQCGNFGTYVSLAVCAPPVYACRARGFLGSCGNLQTGQGI